MFIGEGATGVHREQIVLHEIGHIVCGHGDPGSTELLEQLMPNIDPATIRKVLNRSSYTQPQERQAELVATLTLARMGRLAPTRRTGQAGLDATLGRLDVALGADG